VTPDVARLKLLQYQIAQDVFGFRVGFKDRSWTQRFIKKVMFWADYNDFVTTFGNKVYWPTEKEFTENPRANFKILAHEYVHLFDAQRRTTFGLSYILPQILSVLGLLMFLGFACVWLWFFALFFLFAAPIPAYWRTRWEVRGYTMSMAVNAWRHGSLRTGSRDEYSKQRGPFTMAMCWPGAQCLGM
jgi:hypothetical protein